MPRAFITGITGQDGQHLAAYLHGRGYDVYGMVKGQSNPRIASLLEEMPFVETVPGDLRDLPSLIAAVELSQPDEVYNLGAISFVALSFRQPELTADITGVGVLRMLEAIRIVGGTDNNPIRFYQASSSEMFGKVRETPQTERTPFHPRSPVRRAPRCSATTSTLNYRESYGIARRRRASCFNHEGERAGSSSSPARSPTRSPGSSSASRTRSASGNLDCQARLGLRRRLRRGDVDDAAAGRARRLRDRHRRDPHDRRVPRRAPSACVGIDDWRRTSRQDPQFIRPAEVDLLIGDPTKATNTARVAAQGRLSDPGVDDGPPRSRGRGQEGGRPTLTVPGSNSDRRWSVAQFSSGMSVIASMTLPGVGATPMRN